LSTSCDVDPFGFNLKNNSNINFNEVEPKETGGTGRIKTHISTRRVRGLAYGDRIHIKSNPPVHRSGAVECIVRVGISDIRPFFRNHSLGAVKPLGDNRMNESGSM